MGGQNSGKPEGYGKQVKIESVLKLLENKYLETKDINVHFVEEVKMFTGEYDFNDVKKVFLDYKDVLSWSVNSVNNKTDVTFVMKK